MKNHDILISGAGTAGLALGYWLRRYGFRPTILAQPPPSGAGSHKVDLRGAAVEAADRMGVLSRVRAASADMQGATFIDGGGRPLATLSPELFGLLETEDVEIMRGSLNRILYDTAQGGIEYVFDDSIAAAVQHGNQVTVVFDKGDPRDFDLLVGADGAHSNVRSLVFGAESRFTHDFGAYAAMFTVPNFFALDRSELVYIAPGKTTNVYSARGEPDARALFLFASNPFIDAADERRATEEQKALLARTFEDEGWEVPRLLEAMQDAPDFYFDRIAQIQLERWSKNRVVLLGDAGYAPSFASGQSTSQELVGAYVLAGELAAADGDYEIAFPRYEQKMRAYVEANHALGREAIEHMIVRDRLRLQIQTLILRALPLLPGVALSWFYSRMTREITRASNAITLEEYRRRFVGAA